MEFSYLEKDFFLSRMANENLKFEIKVSLLLGLVLFVWFVFVVSERYR